MLLFGLDLRRIGRLSTVTARRHELRQLLLHPPSLPFEITLLPRPHEQERRSLRRRPAIEGHAREEGREVVVVVLGVLLERMIVAAGTADPCPEKRLGRGVGCLRLDRLLLADGDDPPSDRR